MLCGIAMLQAIRYTPTVIDLYLTRARIYKHAGDIQRASDECEIARNMDHADRCVASVLFGIVLCA